METVLQVVTATPLVSPDLAHSIAEAIHDQFQLDFNPAWGVQWSAQWCSIDGNGPSLNPRRPILYILDMVPDQRMKNYPGYHIVNANGMPEAYVNAAHPVLSAGQWSLPIIVSHEALELAANPYINRYVDGGDGNLYFMEVCDPVEGQVYWRGPHGLCDFVYPEWFVSGSKGKVDQMGACSGPLAVVQGGRLFRQPFVPNQQLVGAAELWEEV